MRARLVLLLVILAVAISGCSLEPTREEIVYCAADSDCICGNIVGKDQCYVGNRAFIEPSDRCFSTCFGDPNKGPKCIDNECEWISLKKGEPESPVGEITCEGIESEDKDTVAITVKNTGPVPFTPLLNLVIIRNNLTILDEYVQYDTIGLGEFQIKYIPVPMRNITGEWVYNLTLYGADGKVIRNVVKTYQRLPPPTLNGFMAFKIKPRHKYLTNISVAVNNSGNLTFTPVVEMTIYKSDMNSIFSVNNVYPALAPGERKDHNFALPPIDNTTYYFNFILSENQNKTIIEEITHKVLIGISE